jgi:hypothetical protein
MIKFAEIINSGNHIRIVTQDSDSSGYNEPIEFEHTEEIETIEQLIEVIRNHFNSGSQL